MLNQLKTALTCTGPPEEPFFPYRAAILTQACPAWSLKIMAVPARPQGMKVPGTMGMTVCVVLRLSRESDNREERCVSSCAPRLLETRSVTYYRAVYE
jgi:hypothetical protein